MMAAFSRFKPTLDSIGSYVYALCEIDGDTRRPFYIGKGKGGRCLQHLTDTSLSAKTLKIAALLQENRLAIDILRHGLNDSEARLIEATCIDLLGVGELTNKVRGGGAQMGRATLEELHHLYSGDSVTVLPAHRGLAFLLNSTYTSGMSELALFEATRGVWTRVPREDDTLKFAYATYGGLVKEVYEIHGWVKAGTQHYFTRQVTRDPQTRRWEFIGRVAEPAVRARYVGKVLEKDRSYGDPFIKVG